MNPGKILGKSASSFIVQNGSAMTIRSFSQCGIIATSNKLSKTSQYKRSGVVSKNVLINKPTSFANVHSSVAINSNSSSPDSSHSSKENETVSNFNYENIDQIIERLKQLSVTKIIKDIDSVYLFKITDTDKNIILDLNTSSTEFGDVFVYETSEDYESSSPTSRSNAKNPSDMPHVTMCTDERTFIRIFNRTCKPSTAFMTGQMILYGDMRKALILETLIREDREERMGINVDSSQSKNKKKTSIKGMSSSFPMNNTTLGRLYHTSSMHRFAADTPPPAKYESVEEVFDRISKVANKTIVESVQAIYLFDVEGKGKYRIDFKNGDGCVGEEKEGAEKADVTITMNENNFMKIFNREMSPASAFMTGQIKVGGDLSKALTLEKIMKAAREAAEKSASEK